MLANGERQVAPDLSGIRRDHTARYRWAAGNLPRGSRVLDLACGVGYGAYILGTAGHRVLAIDKSHDAIAYAFEHYAHPKVGYRVVDAMTFRPAGKNPKFDAVTCFETIEHLEDPRPMLEMFAEFATTLFASVPNEENFPFKNYAFHHRHYTRAEFEQLLAECGWEVVEWWGQEGPESDVREKVNGRTAVVVAKRAAKRRNRSLTDIVVEEAGDAIAAGRLDAGKFDAPFHAPPDVEVQFNYPPIPNPVPERVAILGLGPTLNYWVHHTRCAGNVDILADEVWGINALGNVLRCDRVFHMDDVRIQEVRAAANPTGNIAGMLRWMKQPHDFPIYTSRPHPEYPSLVAFPIADVLNALGGHRYFNNTTAYAIAYAIYIGVKEIVLFGIDFSYENEHRAEKGRACVEFWMGIAAARGIRISVCGHSPLMDGCVDSKERFYGYDTLALRLEGPPGQEVMKFRELETLPTAEEMEHRYNHSRHPNALSEAIQEERSQ